MRLLGVTVDYHLSWSPHIGCVTPAIIKLVVQFLALSHLEYSIIWSAASKTDKANLSAICPFLHGVEEMQCALSWPLLQDRLQYNLLMFLKKILIFKPASVF